jgi:hypothetical protein
MKTILHFAFFGTITLLLMASSACASLVSGADPSFGANSLATDTQTELAWLNLSFTAGLSNNQVLTDLQPGGMFSGYTFASSQQVTGLFADAGISGTGNFSLSTPAISSLISFVGSTGPINGEDLGDWLVKPVPEPGVGSIAIVGLIACAIMGRLIFRQIV